MKKQVKNQIFKSVLLLLSVVLLVASTVIVAVANAISLSTMHTLIINFDEYVSKCTVTYEIDQSGNTKTKDVTSGETLSFFDGAHVSVEFEVKDGKRTTFSYADIENRASESRNIIEWHSFVANNTVDVTCTDITYTIHALNSNGVSTGSTYDYLEVTGSQNTVDDLTSGKVLYQINSDEVVELPRVKKTNWIFKGWYIVTNATDAAQNGGIFIEPVSEDGPCYMPKTLPMTDYMHAQNDVIYVYPYFVPEYYDIYREDWIYKESGNHLQTQLFSYKMENVAVGDWYSALGNELGDAWKGWQDDLDAGGYKSYAGYLLMTDCICVGECDENCIYAAKKVYNTDSDPTRNTVYRYYTPIWYSLIFDLNGDDGESITFNNTTTQYLYGNRAEIAIPERVGYVFSGWKVKIYRDGQWTSENVPHLLAAEEGEDAGKYLLGTKYAKYEEATGKWNDLNAVYASEANENGDYEIKLIAQWTPIDISIEYEFGAGVDVANKGDFQEGGKFTTFKYDADIIIDNPVRTGWMFTGWEMAYADGSALPTDIGLSKLNDNQYQITGSIHAKNIVLTAKWAPETYTVVLDANGDGVPEFTISDVEYGSTSWVSKIPADLAAPTKEGYTFSGYWGNGNQYIYAVEGKLVAENIAWNIDGGANGATITLNAEWTINRYTVTLDSIDGLPAGSDFTIKVIVGTDEPEEYTAFPVSFELDYNTTFRIEIKLSDNLRIARWNGEKADYYTNEWFVSGNITLGAENMTLTAEARPAKPNFGLGYDVNITVKSETEIQVDFKNADVAKLYDVAISNRESEEGLEWHKVADGETQYVFAGLDQGTKYFVFVRFSKTETTLEGIPDYREKTTNFINYVKDVENLLKDMITDTDGDCVKVLINAAIEDIYDLIPEDGELPDDFKALVDGIVAAVQQKLEFARLQDSKIAELQAYRDECGASGSFHKVNLEEIGSLCAQAVADISVATTSEQLEEIYNTAMVAIRAVPVTYLRDTNNSIMLESLIGLNHGSSITLSSIEDIRALRRAIADAIAAGKITADSFITVEAATELLRALDTVRAYSFNLINVQASEGDVFTLTFTIPEALINHTGLQVAYFNQATGLLELLETTREGNTLVFKAKYIADFVILADPTVDLTAVIIALGAILLCQLIAIVLVLVARNKAKKSVMHASVALPMFLTIHFLPVANAELIALGLGVAVLLAQIVLMWLLLSSGMIRVFKTKRRAHTEQEITAVVREEDLQEEPYAAPDEEPVADNDEVVDEAVDEVIDEVIDEVFNELAEEFIEEATEEVIEEITEEPVEEALDEEAFDEELAQELAQEEEYAEEEYAEEEYVNDEYAEDEYAEEVYADEEHADEEYIDEEYAESTEEVVEETLPEEVEEVYEDEELTEQETSDDSYSTDEEENVYAYDEEEAERVSDAQEANQEIEETAYDTDPFAGVFGESDRQDGDSSNEGGDSWDADAYGESYEYGDEADAPYAEAEDDDREETKGQRTVDPYAYIIEDDGEEISDDEEMYQYDE